VQPLWIELSLEDATQMTDIDAELASDLGATPSPVAGWPGYKDSSSAGTG